MASVGSVVDSVGGVAGVAVAVVAPVVVVARRRRRVCSAGRGVVIACVQGERGG